MEIPLVPTLFPLLHPPLYLLPTSFPVFPPWSASAPSLKPCLAPPLLSTLGSVDAAAGMRKEAAAAVGDTISHCSVSFWELCTCNWLMHELGASWNSRGRN